MNIIHSDLEKENGRIIVTNEIWKFVVIAVSLTVVTMGSWWLSERNLKSRQSNDIAKKGDSIP